MAAVPALGSSDVHVWKLLIPGTSPDVERLSDEERRRSGSIVAEEARRRFQISRGFLRTLLERTSGLDLKGTEFSYGLHGRPEMTRTGLRFNLTHSADLILVAITRSGPVGIDVEKLRLLPSLTSIIERYLNPDEVRWFQQRPTEVRVREFLRLWTLKEACAKALDLPIITALKTIDVSLDPREPLQLHSLGPDQPDPTGWTLTDFEPHAGYLAALCTDRDHPKLSFFEA